MRLTAILTLTILAASILSYGMPGTTHAQTDDETSIIEEDLPPISVQTDSPTYEPGNAIVITGKIKTVDTDLAPDLTLIILKPDGSGFAHVEQITPNDDGTYEVSVPTGSSWTRGGEYGIKVTYGANEATTSFHFAGANITPECPPGQSLVGGQCTDDVVECDEGQILQGGECVEEEQPISCPPGQSLVGDECIDDPPPPPVITCEDGEELRGDTCVSICGAGTTWVNGQCVASAPPAQDDNGGCLIATAAYGTEMAPQVQYLREIRDNTVMSTTSGASFMGAFSTVYYSFSPAIADLERESPAFREATKLFITPMLSTLSIMTLAQEGSESQILGLGISVIALNLGMYVAAPTLIGIRVVRRLRVRI